MSTSVECAFPGSGLTASEDSSKLPLLRDIIAERGRPTFVVHWFRNTGQQIGEMLDDMDVSWVAIDGSTPPNARKTAVNSFQQGASAVLLGSVSVVAEGLTLTAADEVVMMERSWVPSQNEQVIRRLHRIGQTRPVSVRQLVTPKSVDTLQWKALDEKQQGIEPVISRKQLSTYL
jgi:SNF2 family DNA or RNA helicase